MKTICLYFQVHQPYRHKKYSFFNIGNDHYYYDDYLNESVLQRVANKCYLPANQSLLEQIEKHQGNFKVTFSISGTALEQFERYAPEVINSFQKLAQTGCVEFLSETYSHSLVALHGKKRFRAQVIKHQEKIKELFNLTPKVFRNTELVYSDMIGKDVFEMGFKGMLAEGAKHILGWKSPNYLYCNSLEPKLKLLLRNYTKSDDIAFRFSNQSWKDWPLTADKFEEAVKEEEGEILNLFMDYETFGEHQWRESGIFDFLAALPNQFISKGHRFATPSDVLDSFDPISPISMPYSTSWADEERDLSAWLGNEMQKEAFQKLYNLADLVEICQDEQICQDWIYLQTSDYFYYMSTKWFSDGDVHAYFNPYNSPYDAFINYMNILSDFAERLNANLGNNSIENIALAKASSQLEETRTELQDLKKYTKALESKLDLRIQKD